MSAAKQTPWKCTKTISAYPCAKLTFEHLGRMSPRLVQLQCVSYVMMSSRKDLAFANTALDTYVTPSCKYQLLKTR